MANGTTILIALESHEGTLRGTAYEAFAAGRSLADETGGTLVALAIGSGINEGAAQLGSYGADRVLAADAPELSSITVDGYSKAIGQAIDQIEPDIVLLAGTTAGRDIAAFLAGKRGAAHLPDCSALRIDGSLLVARRPVYGNKMMTEVTAELGQCVFATLHTGAFKAPEADSSRQVEIEPLELTFAEGDIRVKIKGLESSAGEAADLTSADVVVIGGRGLGSEENYQLVQDLADAMGGAAGATRAVTDLGWRPHYEQVGQTGQKISPKLYIGVGVSGAVQHTVGMVGSENIVAINRDPAAPIFKMADFGLVGDLEEIVPKLIERIKAKKGA
ncbi:MAG: electron transfer flavoprotein subunit alpha/FixB family protein [Thermomicrobiaceae bacterium]